MKKAKIDDLRNLPNLVFRTEEYFYSNDKIISDYGVNYIVDGNLRVQSDQLRLNAQLIDITKNEVINARTLFEKLFKFK